MLQQVTWEASIWYGLAGIHPQDSATPQPTSYTGPLPYTLMRVPGAKIPLCHGALTAAQGGGAWMRWVEWGGEMVSALVRWGRE